jgi:hypothetical protein
MSTTERLEAGKRINPETAIVFFVYAHIADPYGEDPDLPEEYQASGAPSLPPSRRDRKGTCG